jgi:nuclear GTP-binding protein
VREHHKKKRKEEKKAGKKAPKLKDPGIPAAWPFKEELIKELAWKRQQILMDEKAKREERKRAREVGGGRAPRGACAPWRGARPGGREG